MDKTKIKAWHFRNKEGSSATRADSQGISEHGDVQLLPSVYEQLSNMVNGAGSDGEFDRQGGHYRKMLRAEQRRAFERIFVDVAEARLPKDYFMCIQEEARRIWRGEFADLVPPDHRHMKKIRNLRKKQTEHFVNGSGT